MAFSILLTGAVIVAMVALCVLYVQPATPSYQLPQCIQLGYTYTCAPWCVPAIWCRVFAGARHLYLGVHSSEAGDMLLRPSRVVT